jgi:tetratricopeptide (TPR) repeat protein
MRLLIRSFTWALAIALVIFTATKAGAEDKAAARAAFRAATQHFNLGEYQDALAGFKTAYRNFEDPSFLFNIAQCERLLGHKQEAVRAYRTYLTNSPNAPNGPEVRTLISKLEDELKQESETAKSPPQGTLSPPPLSGTSAATTPGAEPTPNRAALVAATPTPAPANERPVYKRAWFWATVVGGAAAVGLAVGLGVGLTQGSSGPAAATTSLGTAHPF